MNMFRSRGLGVAALLLTTIVGPACSDFLDVDNPNNLESESIDEDKDRTLLSRSARPRPASRRHPVARADSARETLHRATS
jgi:hypothetical protein